MSLQTFASRVRGRASLLRARIVPAAVIMLLMMVLAVGFLTDSASAATTDDNKGLNVGGDPILIYILIAIGVVCLVLWKFSEEDILLYSFVGCIIGAVVIFLVNWL